MGNNNSTSSSSSTSSASTTSTPSTASAVGSTVGSTISGSNGGSEGKKREEEWSMVEKKEEEEEEEEEEKRNESRIQDGTNGCGVVTSKFLPNASIPCSFEFNFARWVRVYPLAMEMSDLMERLQMRRKNFKRIYSDFVWSCSDSVCSSGPTIYPNVNIDSILIFIDGKTTDKDIKKLKTMLRNMPKHICDLNFVVVRINGWYSMEMDLTKQNTPCNTKERVGQMIEYLCLIVDRLYKIMGSSIFDFVREVTKKEAYPYLTSLHIGHEWTCDMMEMYLYAVAKITGHDDIICWHAHGEKMLLTAMLMQSLSTPMVDSKGNHRIVVNVPPRLYSLELGGCAWENLPPTHVKITDCKQLRRLVIQSSRSIVHVSPLSANHASIKHLEIECPFMDLSILFSSNLVLPNLRTLKIICVVLAGKLDAEQVPCLRRLFLKTKAVRSLAVDLRNMRRPLKYVGTVNCKMHILFRKDQVAFSKLHKT